MSTNQGGVLGACKSLSSGDTISAVRRANRTALRSGHKPMIDRRQYCLTIAETIVEVASVDAEWILSFEGVQSRFQVGEPSAGFAHRGELSDIHTPSDRPHLSTQTASGKLIAATMPTTSPSVALPTGHCPIRQRTSTRFFVRKSLPPSPLFSDHPKVILSGGRWMSFS